MGGAHILQDVFQHLSQKQKQNRYLTSVCFFMVNDRLAGWWSGWLAGGLAGLAGWLADWLAGGPAGGCSA